MTQKTLVRVVAIGTLLSLLGARPLEAKEATPKKKASPALVKAFAAYLREPDKKKRAAIFKKNKKAADALSFDALEAAILRALPGSKWKSGFTHDVKYESGGDTWTYSVWMPKKRPSKGLVPLVLDVGHASWRKNKNKKIAAGMENWLRVAGATNDVIYVRTRVLDRLEDMGRYKAYTTPPRKPLKKASKKASATPTMDSLSSLLLDCVRDVCLRYPVDPERIYVQGISQTGFWTWWLGQHAPDRFAAIAPVGSVTWHVRKLLANLQSMPIYILHGTNDTTCPFAQAKSAAEALKAMKAPVDFRPSQGGEHMDGVFVRFKEIWPEVMKRRRVARPKTFVHHFVSEERPWCYWVGVAGIAAKEFNPWGAPCKLEASIKDQHILIDVKGCKTVTIHLHSNMLDLEKPLQVTLNDETKTIKTLAPDPERALESAWLRGDAAAFSAFVDLKVR